MEEKQTFWSWAKETWHSIISLGEEMDPAAAEVRIRGSVDFRGTNVWILACSIVIASVGLNINSIPVIIGAMLISPLMGPIIGMGLSLGLGDQKLLLEAFKNFLVMVGVSLFFAFIYFLITPLALVNASELEARTSPTIFDVFIALFGGIAGMLENSRKERGTVLSGVAIATALMPPLCTAGYGLANSNWAYFFGAMYLFVINTVFILLATYITSLYLHFGRGKESNPQSRSFRNISIVIVIAIIIPSVFSAISMIKHNNEQRNIQGFVKENRTFGRAYIYDYTTVNGKAEIYFAGELKEEDMEKLKASALRHGLDTSKVKIKSNAFGARADELLQNVYARADEQIAVKDARIKELEAQLESLKEQELPYSQITRELKYQHPLVQSLSLARGVNVTTDSLKESARLNALIYTESMLKASELDDITLWLRIRLNDSTALVNNIVLPKP